MPVPGVGYPRLTAPFATSPGYCYPGFVRLACLIHAANVRSEPGSNPSKELVASPRGQAPGSRIKPKDSQKGLAGVVSLGHDSKDRCVK